MSPPQPGHGAFEESLTPLFHDYLYDFARVARFYPAAAPFDFDRLAARARDLAWPPDRRAAMAAELARQNPGADAALAEFARPGAGAILTGQQVGLFGGPLLAVHKAMTAVVIAQRLRARGTPAVPIFWLATQDHDLAEVNQAWLLDDAATLHPLRAQFDAAAAGQPVGALPLDASVSELLAQAERCTPGDWSAVRAAYAPGATLGSAFAGLLRAWFAPWGLLVFDPRQAPAAHALWQPYYLAAFDRQPELATRLAGRATALTAATYHVQVEQTAAASMLFLEQPEGRLGLRYLEGKWLLGDSVMDAAGLRQRLAAAPGRVSPAALLRPVLQDAAFPTLAHVVGPAETAYLAQAAVLYEALGVRQPVAWPRARITLLDARAQRLLQKFELSLDDLRATPAADLLARRALPEGIAARAAALLQTVRSGFASLTPELATLDPTLLDAARGAAQKIEHQLAQLESRVARALTRRGGELAVQARHLDNFLFPQRQPQDRVLAAAGVFARAPQALAALHAALDPAHPGHQVIPL
ncbi:MAG: bacillithiol biosynthesis cysteine-adding enzyme BshC [Terriglobales bacterium]